MELEETGLTQKDAEDGNWFKNQSLSSYQFAPGYIDTEVNEDGKAQCNDIVKLTAPMYGVSNLQMLCMFDAKREDGSSCLNSKSKGDDARFKDLNYKAFDPAIAFGSAEYKNSDAGYYLLNYAAFTSPDGCNASVSSSPGGEDFTYTVNYVNGQSLVEGATFTGLKKDQNITVYVSNPNLINQNRDCSVIAADLSKQRPHTQNGSWTILTAPLMTPVKAATRTMVADQLAVPPPVPSKA